MYAISALLYQHFFQHRQARQHYLALSGKRASSATFNKLNREISSGTISDNNLALLLKDNISPRIIDNALVKTRQQKQQQKANAFKPSLTAVFVKPAKQQQQSSNLNLPYFYKAWLYNVTLPEKLAEQSWQLQQQLLAKCCQQHQHWFNEQAATSRAVKILGEIYAYCYRVSPHLEAELSSSGQVGRLYMVKNS